MDKSAMWMLGGVALLLLIGEQKKKRARVLEPKQITAGGEQVEAPLARAERKPRKMVARGARV